MLSINKVITIVVLSLIVSCAPNNWAPNFSLSNVFQSKSDKLNDTLIIPGKQVGAVTEKTNRADLVKMFGESKLKDDVVLEDEGTISVPVTKVNLGGEKYFTVAWEEDTRQNLLYIRDFGSAWKTPEGIGVGTTFKELQENLGDFKLTRLGWVMVGFIDLETTKLSKYQGLVSLKVAPDEKAITKNSQQHQAVLSSRQLSSTNPNWQPLDMKVSN
ncbi:MAG: hypothetical protein WBA39_34805 [Rivularia sp. (in: cyanobacteria)]